MSRFTLLALLATLLAVGCKKDQPAAATAPDPNPAAVSPRGPGTVPDAPSVATVPDAGSVDANLHNLASELRNYVVRTRTVPKNFDEFVAKAKLQVPPPPPGKKYAIKGQEIVLVKA